MFYYRVAFRYYDYSICLLFFVQIEVQQLQYQMDSVDGDLVNMTEQKLKNRADLLARQQKTKYYQKVMLLPSPISLGLCIKISKINLCIFDKSVVPVPVIRFASLDEVVKYL